MILKKNKKTAQAAIEFLMTYGWMLLIVLIVGALIFTFVDFTSLLPNKIELNNNLHSKPSESYASAETIGNASYVLVVFQYVGTSKIEIDVADNSSKITSLAGEVCNLKWVKNPSTLYWAYNGAVNSTAGAIMNYSSGDIPHTYTKYYSNGKVQFINGHTGILEFECEDKLSVNDVLEGDIVVYSKNVRTGVPVPSAGSFRIKVTV